MADFKTEWNCAHVIFPVVLYVFMSYGSGQAARTRDIIDKLGRAAYRFCSLFLHLVLPGPLYLIFRDAPSRWCASR
jgi:hypothetical protein